ncbi:MAG: nitronate monooxygenase [Chloroflexi bacterium]|nr:nitronate monooxygenase [Chloroflexota bacterium]
MLKTRITERLGIQYPVISAPMAQMSGGRLAAAVSSAGGLGTFGCANAANTIGPDYIRQQIDHIRSQTDKPFGAGFLTQHIARAPQNFETVLEQNVPVILFSFADPTPWLGRAKDSGAVTVCQVQTMEGARLAVAGGADILAAQGNDAGGHTGMLSLLPFLVRVVAEFPDVPIIAAGGIGDGRSLAAVLAAGAEGAWMGTVFTATQEDDEVPDAHKELIVMSDGENTIYTEVFNIINDAVSGGAPWPEGLAARAYNNRFAQEWHGRETELRDRLDEIIPAYVEARQRGDYEIRSALFGKAAAFVNAIRPAGDVLRTICDEAEQHLRQRFAELVH